VLPLERQHRLRGEAQCVGDSDADAPVADVESEIAGDGRAFQSATPVIPRLWLPAYSLQRRKCRSWFLCPLEAPSSGYR
jgi:hypothetical protein